MKMPHLTAAGPALIALIALGGCAPMTWQKNGGTQDEFSRAQYTCMQQSQQRVAGATVNAFGGYATNQVVTNDGLYRACMNASGWAQQVAQARQPIVDHEAPAAVPPGRFNRTPKPLEKTNSEKLHELDAELAAEQRTRCESVEYASVLEHTPCRGSTMTAEQLTDRTRLSDGDKAAFIKLMDAREAGRRAFISKATIWGESISVPWTAAMEREVAAARINAANLLAGKITWGEFNKRRNELGESYKAEYAKIVASK